VVKWHGHFRQKINEAWHAGTFLAGRKMALGLSWRRHMQAGERRANNSVIKLRVELIFSMKLSSGAERMHFCDAEHIVLVT